MRGRVAVQRRQLNKRIMKDTNMYVKRLIILQVKAIVKMLIC